MHHVVIDAAAGEADLKRAGLAVVAIADAADVDGGAACWGEAQGVAAAAKAAHTPHICAADVEDVAIDVGIEGNRQRAAGVLAAIHIGDQGSGHQQREVVAVLLVGGLCSCDVQCWSIIDGIDFVAQHHQIAAEGSAAAAVARIEQRSAAVINAGAAIHQGHREAGRRAVEIQRWLEANFIVGVDDNALASIRYISNVVPVAAITAPLPFTLGGIA